MIEKFLIRFCAPEVRTMITRMHERPEDFGYGNRWRDLAEMRKGFTWVERKVLDKEWAKFKKNEKRREVLSLITREVIDPTPTEGLYRYPAGIFAGASVQNGVISSYTDTRAMYGKFK
jgi:hypothetical protein